MLTARTDDTRLLVPAGDQAPMCLQVRLIRGALASDWAQTCVVGVLPTC